uniref:DNA-directed RNA polymerase subunit beta n=1 Tax=Derbesia sp. WEST4838 TaxID=1847751 RepID=A0A1C9JBI4_9CHLO|nr:RNA polymerase b-subunit [Derbesia sp. WEST4838]AOP19206.1 RNA polymerase b-subunit [Derbesia sp. WEST4838]
MFILIYKFLFFLVDLLRIQRESFFQFLEKDLGEEIDLQNGFFWSDKKIQITLYGQYYQLIRPKLTIKECLLKGKTYKSEIFVPVHIQFRWICLGEIPLMTNRGHFIINGSPRIIVNQLIRSEGIYFKQEINNINISGQNEFFRTFYVDVISKRGIWIRIELDRKRKVYICMKKTPKIPMFLFLKAIGFTDKTIFNNFNEFPQLIKYYSGSAIDSIFGNFDTYQNEENKAIQQSIFEKLLNIQSYDLGKNGRKQINLKLGLNVKTTTLTPLDCLGITQYLLQSYNNKRKFDDIDDLNNRRIRSIGDLLQIQIQQALQRLQKLLTEKSKKSDILPYLISTKPFNSTMQEFFNSCILSQFLDQVNPLAELTHKRRISALGPNGIKRETAGMDIRSIHSTYFGRLCPIETPEGKNAGLVNSLAIYTLPNSKGFLQAPYLPVFKGQIQKHLKPIYFDANTEKPFHIILADYKLSKLNFLMGSDYIMRQFTELKRTSRELIQYCTFSPLQLISVATSLIPFMEHNDANRVLMGSNMQRQAIPLLLADASNIRTKFDTRVISDTNYIQKVRISGIVLYLSQTEVHIYTPNKRIKERKNDISKLRVSQKTHNLFSKSFNLAKNSNSFNSSQLKINYSFFSIYLQYRYRKCITNRFKSRQPIQVFNFYLSTKISYFALFYQKKLNYYNIANLKIFENINLKLFRKLIDFTNFNLRKESSCYTLSNLKFQSFESTNQGTFQIQKPFISTLDWLYKGQLISDCASSENGRLALGRNLLVAYIPWQGYNFEDAILLNEKLILNEKFVSIHIEKYEFEVKETSYGLEKITRDLPISHKKLAHLDENGIIKLGSRVTSGLLLIGKIAPIEPRTLLPHEKLLYDIVGKKVEKIKDVSLYAPSTIDGRVIYITVNNNHYISQSFEEEKCLQVCLYIAEKRNLQVGDKLSGRHGNKGVISQILPNQDCPFLLNGQTIDIILNPLGVPSRMNVGQLFEALLGLAAIHLKEDYKIEVFDEKYGFDASRSIVYFKLVQLRKQTNHNWFFSKNFPGKMFLFNGQTGEKFMEPAMVGETYILKLIHMVEEKIHARSTGPYSLVTQQPLKGRAKHGGQRFGEMEVWALEGFGSAYILQELLTIKSDDTVGRNKIMEGILENQNLYFGTPESFKVLLRELQALCINLKICDRILN